MAAKIWNMCISRVLISEGFWRAVFVSLLLCSVFFELACRCRCRVLLQGAVAGCRWWVPLQNFSSGCCCQSAVCDMKLGCWCCCRGWLRESYVMIGPDLPCGTTPKTNSAQIWLSRMTMKKRAAFIKGLPGFAIHMTRSISTLLSVLCL